MAEMFPLQQRFSIHQNTSRAEQEKKLQSAAQMYEQHFLNEMVRAMRKTVPESEESPTGSFAQKIFREQLDDQYVKAWADKGGIGLAQLIYDQLQEKVLGSSSQLPLMKGPLKIPPTGLLPLPNQSLNGKEDKKMTFVWSVPLKSNKEDFVVRSPWSGKITKNFTTPEGRTLISIRHNENVESLLNYKGRGYQLRQGESLEEGQAMGQLDLASPSLVWTVTKNSST